MSPPPGDAPDAASGAGCVPRGRPGRRGDDLGRHVRQRALVVRLLSIRAEGDTEILLEQFPPLERDAVWAAKIKCGRAPFRLASWLHGSTLPVRKRKRKREEKKRLPAHELTRQPNGRAASLHVARSAPHGSG
jgi:hypothetical protein